MRCCKVRSHQCNERTVFIRECTRPQHDLTWPGLSSSQPFGGGGGGGGSNPSLIGTGPYQYFSGPYGWQISQTCDDPLGLRDIRRRWLPEFDKALGKAKGLGLLDKHTNTYTRIFGAGTTVTFNRTSGQGTIQWSDGTVTRGPGCAPSAPKCQNCFPPMYEQGSLADGTGGCVES